MEGNSNTCKHNAAPRPKKKKNSNPFKLSQTLCNYIFSHHKIEIWIPAVSHPRLDPLNILEIQIVQNLGFQLAVFAMIATSSILLISVSVIFA